MKNQILSRFARRTAAAAAIASLAAGAGLLAAAPAQAATSFAAEHPGYYTLVNAFSNKVLDINNFDTKPGGKAIQWGEAKPNKNQHWFFRDAGNGYTEIVNRNSGLVLSIEGGNSAPGARAVQWNSTGAADQRWTFNSEYLGYRIENAATRQNLTTRGSSLDDGADAVQSPSVGASPSQNWKLVKIADADFASSSYTAGNYTIRSAQTGRVLDISENSKKEGGQAIQWPAHGGVNQQWSFRTIYGKTQIGNRSSGLILGVSQSSTANDAKVIQWTDVNVADQRWVVEPVAGKANTYTITNDNSGKRLSVSRDGLGSTPNDIIQSAPTSGAEQQWVITPAS